MVYSRRRHSRLKGTKFRDLLVYCVSLCESFLLFVRGISPGQVEVVVIPASCFKANERVYIGASCLTLAQSCKYDGVV